MPAANWKSEVPATHPEQTQPQPHPGDPRSQINGKAIRRRRKRRPRMPSSRAMDRFCRKCHGQTERQIAREDKVAPASVHRSIERCQKYIAATRMPLSEVDPVGQLHAAYVTEALELEALRKEAEEIAARAETPYPGRTTIIKRKDQPDEKRVVMYQEPPRQTHVRERRMLTKDIANARRGAAIAQLEAQEAAQEKTASGPDAVNALAPIVATASSGHEFTEQRWFAMDRRHRTYGDKGQVVYDGSLAERTTYWRYQALGTAQGLTRDARHEFAIDLMRVDDTAIRAAAMVEAGARGREGEGARGREGEGASEHEAALHAAFCGLRSQREYLEALLILDFDFSREACERIMAHFDEASGRFHWTTPAEDLRWISEHQQQRMQQEMAELNGEQPPPPKEPEELTDEEEWAEQDRTHAVFWGLDKPPDYGVVPDSGGMELDPSGRMRKTRPIRYTEGPRMELTAEKRQELINSFRETGVALLRFKDYTMNCRHLHDMPNDQSSVVIWELLEEVLPAEQAREGEGASGRGGESSSRALIVSPASPRPLSPSSSLTPEQRDRLLKKLHPEGVAVITPDGQEYTGKSLGECGLPQRGILFLRELCHSIPPWGESHWDTLHRDKPGARG